MNARRLARRPALRLLQRFALAAALLSTSATGAVSATGAMSAPPAPEQRIDLAHSTWTRNAVAPSDAPRVSAEPGGQPLVELPCDAKGLRWATSFDTDVGRMARLDLQWCGAPDGLLFEVVLDGQRLQPARDAWRPTPRALTSDLGSLWVGPGGHLLEIVVREQPMAPSSVRLSALRLEWLGA